MPVTQYMGSSGILMRQLEQTMPGAYAFVFAFAILIGVLFVYKINKLQENPKEVFMYFALLGFMSFILFGNMAAFLGIMLIVGCYWFYARHAWAKAEKLTGEEQNLAKKFFPELMAKLEAAEQAEKGAKKKGDEEAEEAKMGETVVETEKMETALVAAETDLAMEIKSVSESTQIASEKEKALIKALIDYSENAEKSLANMGSMTLIDAAGKTVVLSYVQGAAGVCRQLAQTVNENNQKNIRKAINFNRDISMIKDVTAHAKKLSTGIQEIEKKLEKGLGAACINDAVAILNEKNLELRRAQQDYSTADDTAKSAVEQQVKALTLESSQLNDNIKNLREMQKTLSSAIQAVNSTISEIKKNIENILTAEKSIESTRKSFDSNLDKMNPDALVTASGKFNARVSELSAEGVSAAEKVCVESTSSIGEIFSEFLKLQNGALIFYQDISKLIDGLITVLQNTSVLETSLSGLHTAFESIDKGYNELKTATKLITGKPSDDDDRTFAELQSDLENVAVKGNRDLLNYTRQALSFLYSSKSFVSNITQMTSSNIDYIKSSEKTILNIFTRALNAIVSNKTRVDAEFKNKAAAFTVDISKAREALQTART